MFNSYVSGFWYFWYCYWNHLGSPEPVPFNPNIVGDFMVNFVGMDIVPETHIDRREILKDLENYPLVI